MICLPEKKVMTSEQTGEAHSKERVNDPRWVVHELSQMSSPKRFTLDGSRLEISPRYLSKGFVARLPGCESFLNYHPLEGVLSIRAPLHCL